MGRNKTTGRIFKSKGLSLNPELWKRAEARATELGWSFSEYARRCIEDDLRRGGDVVVRPEKGNQPGTKKVRP